nr:MAG TPA: hypothetical protein [Caudoviricetes sp.]
MACLAGCVPVGFALNLGSWSRFPLVVQVRPRVCWGCCVVAGSVGCVRVGVLFSSLLCCPRWVGRPGRSGSSSPPSFSPHATRWRLPGHRIQWVNSHVKTLTDRRSTASGTHTFRFCRTV